MPSKVGVTYELKGDVHLLTLPRIVDVEDTQSFEDDVREIVRAHIGNEQLPITASHDKENDRHIFSYSDLIFSAEQVGEIKKALIHLQRLYIAALQKEKTDIWSHSLLTHGMLDLRRMVTFAQTSTSAVLEDSHYEQLVKNEITDDSSELAGNTGKSCYQNAMLDTTICNWLNRDNNDSQLAKAGLAAALKNGYEKMVLKMLKAIPAHERVHALGGSINTLFQLLSKNGRKVMSVALQQLHESQRQQFLKADISGLGTHLHIGAHTKYPAIIADSLDFYTDNAGCLRAIETVGIQGETPLHHAARTGQMALAKKFLSYYSDDQQRIAAIQAVDINGRSVFYNACLSGHKKTINYILSFYPKGEPRNKVINSIKTLSMEYFIESSSLNDNEKATAILVVEELIYHLSQAANHSPHSPDYIIAACHHYLSLASLINIASLLSPELQKHIASLYQDDSQAELFWADAAKQHVHLEANHYFQSRSAAHDIDQQPIKLGQQLIAQYKAEALAATGFYQFRENHPQFSDSSIAEILREIRFIACRRLANSIKGILDTQAEQITGLQIANFQLGTDINSALAEIDESSKELQSMIQRSQAAQTMPPNHRVVKAVEAIFTVVAKNAMPEQQKQQAILQNADIIAELTTDEPEEQRLNYASMIVAALTLAGMTAGCAVGAVLGGPFGALVGVVMPAIIGISVIAMIEKYGMFAQAKPANYDDKQVVEGTHDTMQAGLNGPTIIGP